MKKLIKRIAITLIAIFTLLGVGTTVAYGAGYILWKGSPAFEQTKQNLSKLTGGIDRIKNDRDSAKQEIKDKEQTIKDKEQALRDKDKALAEKDKEKDRAVAEKQAEVDRKQKEVDEKQKEIEHKQKEIEELQKNQGSKVELEQAYKDMKEVEELSSELLREVEE